MIDGLEWRIWRRQNRLGDYYNKPDERKMPELRPIVEASEQSKIQDVFRWQS